MLIYIYVCIKMLKFVFYVYMYVMYNVYFSLSLFFVFVLLPVVGVHNLECFVILLFSSITHVSQKVCCGLCRFVVNRQK
jgi:hypothetical protein